MPRTPALRSASATRALSRSASAATKLPKPTNTGGGPAARKSSSRGSGRQPGGAAGHQYPQTSWPPGQSAGRRTTVGLNPCRTARPRGRPSGPPNVRAGRPSSRRSSLTAGANSRSVAAHSARPASVFPYGPNEREPVTNGGKAAVGSIGCR